MTYRRELLALGRLSKVQHQRNLSLRTDQVIAHRSFFLCIFMVGLKTIHPVFLAINVSILSLPWWFGEIHYSFVLWPRKMPKNDLQTASRRSSDFCTRISYISPIVTLSLQNILGAKREGGGGRCVVVELIFTKKKKGDYLLNYLAIHKLRAQHFRWLEAIYYLSTYLSSYLYSHRQKYTSPLPY